MLFLPPPLNLSLSHAHNSAMLARINPKCRRQVASPPAFALTCHCTHWTTTSHHLLPPYTTARTICRTRSSWRHAALLASISSPRQRHSRLPHGPPRCWMTHPTSSPSSGPPASSTPSSSPRVGQSDCEHRGRTGKWRVGGRSKCHVWDGAEGERIGWVERVVGDKEEKNDKVPQQISLMKSYEFIGGCLIVF